MERTNAKHHERTIGHIKLNNRTVEIVDTRHGDYRNLEQKRTNLHELSSIIASIDKQELVAHFRAAQGKFNPNEPNWRVQIDYSIAIYNVIDRYVVILGIHPHYNRITICTINQKIIGFVAKRIYAAYRIDTEITKDEVIQEIIPSHLKMKQVFFTAS